MNSEETYKSSITAVTLTLPTRRKETLDINGEPYSNSNCKSASFYFEDIDTSIKLKDINIISIQWKLPQCETFDQSSYKAHVLKVSFEIIIVDSIIFDNHPKLHMSSIHSNCQDD